ncbi:ABC transporter permease [Curtobacterium flaccumfaciens pv. flaccumfaciens]|uniref:ABC transporter permease n=1 Tax=Curtobacterium flaccumfaciens TaxID=2035 RepID=UPI00188D4CFC|nr:ABC transporter permease [Curtobacterium flaccumfaciens]MBF4595246.1 ABC transporter permease [Curtobacterium flaccumfaciens]MBO9048135.1 ABC transporter permease [Curtobacterium flaccumfaciens pv. flaccumfaciens]MBO9058242.1 ABC transporter permease [Curtobacterium flaccumfaciens pv. flaccumfaciens]QTR90205.1 ABC transporter permease [Curtobacterium flaccumfaciens pv. flaccumfaciens]QVG65477.1 ABC transporter permease [Curtobacterium flaccumfaciens pv. flaccumfaciens]
MNNSFVQAVRLVSAREIQARIRSKAFVVSALILIGMVVASIVVGGVVSKATADDTTPVAVVDGVSLPTTSGLDVTESASVDDAERLVTKGDVDAAIVPSDDPLGYKVVGLDEAPSEVVSALSVTPRIELLDPDALPGGLVYLIAIAFGVVYFASAVTFGQSIAQSVVEEKSTRVVEILMSAIPARALLAGKVLGNSIMAFAQIVAVAVAAIVTLAVTGQDNMFAMLGPSILWFIGFFAIGFVLLASLFAAAAVLVSRQEDVGSVTTPVMMLVMIPYFLIIVAYDNPTILGIMSYVPFSAPIGMPMRIFLGTAEWWEPILSLVIVAASVVAVVVIGARVYENALLRTGSRVKLSEALRG